MVAKKYEFKMEKYDEGFRVRLTNYMDENVFGKCATPLSYKDKMIVKNFKGLLKKLDSDKLNVKMELS